MSGYTLVACYKAWHISLLVCCLLHIMGHCMDMHTHVPILLFVLSHAHFLCLLLSIELW